MESTSSSVFLPAGWSSVDVPRVLPPPRVRVLVSTKMTITLPKMGNPLSGM
jgi:hypothetical protein